MTISVIPVSELTDDLRTDWRRLQRSNPDLASPFFSVEFTETVALICKDIELSILEKDGKVSGIFPFQRKKSSLGGPVGGILSDYQALICEPDFVFDPRKLIRASRLAAWDFHHLLRSQKCFAPFHQHDSSSPLMNLSNGYENYALERRAAGSEIIKKCANLARRIAREVGSLHFVDHAADGALLNRVLTWKSQQYVGSSKPDLFASSWCRGVVEGIHQTQTEDCAGMLSLLYAGDVLVAGHLGMRSKTALHYWFPAYDPGFSKYSPGLLLLLKMAESCDRLGLKVIDLGMGASLYKNRLANASVSLASGSVEVCSVLSLQRAIYKKLRTLVVNTPVEASIRKLMLRSPRIDASEKKNPSPSSSQL